MAQITKGTTDVSRYVMLYDVGGSPKTGHTITDLDLTYIRAGELGAGKVDATALGAVDAAHSDNKAIEISSGYMAGLYRVDWPDAPFASGVDTVLLYVKGTDLQPCVEEIELTDPLKTLLAAIDMTDQADVGKLLGQIRMIHAHTGGTEVQSDPATPNVLTYRNEANDADLSVRTRTTDGNNVGKTTRSAP